MTRRRPRSLVLPAITAIALTCGAAYHVVNAPEAPSAVQPETVAGNGVRELSRMDVVTVVPADLHETVRISGELRPTSRASITAKASGTVLAVNARPGERIREGDILVQMDVSDLEATLVQRESGLEAARAQLTLAEQGLNRIRELNSRGFATRSALEKAESDAAAAWANVDGLVSQAESARTAIQDAAIVAPFDGTVTTRSIEPGERAGAGTELLSIVNTATLEAEVMVPTADISRVKPGQEAVLRFDGVGGKTISGSVDRINPVANPGSRFVSIFIRVENPDGVLWGGMFGSGAVTVREGFGITVIPTEAVMEDGAGTYVLKITDGRLVRVAVQRGGAWDGGRTLEVDGPIVHGDMLLAAPLPGLEDGTPVTVADPS